MLGAHPIPPIKLSGYATEMVSKSVGWLWSGTSLFGQHVFPLTLSIVPINLEHLLLKVAGTMKSESDCCVPVWPVRADLGTAQQMCFGAVHVVNTANHSLAFRLDLKELGNRRTLYFIYQHTEYSANVQQRHYYVCVLA